MNTVNTVDLIAIERRARHMRAEALRRGARRLVASLRGLSGVGHPAKARTA
ncbi:RSP_7527 family protein [Jannaschia sp. LMIT008]|uniref:RSP_7527 family protein n=1 Tax=Jannaschia maritima TaxID=3032585 RepID=UPI0028121B21|nr:hypothetical protein [Jannaschia sp. LMIT008]